MRGKAQAGRKRDGANVLFFTMIVLCATVMVFFIIGYEIGNTII